MFLHNAIILVNVLYHHRPESKAVDITAYTPHFCTSTLPYLLLAKYLGSTYASVAAYCLVPYHVTHVPSQRYFYYL
jgi:hypothetical protein